MSGSFICCPMTTGTMGAGHVFDPVMTMWNIQRLCGRKIKTLWRAVTFVDPCAKRPRLKTLKSIPPVREGLGGRSSAGPRGECGWGAVTGRGQVKRTDSFTTNGKDIGKAVAEKTGW